MSEEAIKLRLDELSEVMSARDVARIDYQTARNALIPQEIQIALADLDAEFTLRDAAIALNIEELEKIGDQASRASPRCIRQRHALACGLQQTSRHLGYARLGSLRRASF